jgi:non-homologous end joining protein Ku
MRPYWKGYLKLALVSCPIALHAACSTAERIAFRQINKATGNRLFILGCDDLGLAGDTIQAIGDEPISLG